jgi:hypothetical protein
MRLHRLLFTVALVLVGSGCAFNESRVPIQESITIDPSNPKRIRFVMHGDPGLRRYPEIKSLPLPMHEKIRQGMQRYAADELRARNWCTNGFLGPEVVLADESARLTSRFWVDCL